MNKKKHLKPVHTTDLFSEAFKYGQQIYNQSVSTFLGNTKRFLPQITFLLLVYVLLSDVVYLLPYFNVILGLEVRLILLLMLSLLLINPTTNTLILSCMVFLVLTPFSEVFGILIFITLLFTFFKNFKELAKA